MLVLTRRVGETIVVPSCDLTMQILSVQGDKIRLGFTAPKETQIHRAEVWERIASRDIDANVGELVGQAGR